MVAVEAGQVGPKQKTREIADRSRTLADAVVAESE